ncbi:MAG: serine/threonine protein kinase [Chthonomonas sp.]
MSVSALSAYELGPRIGSGGMGVVFGAKHRVLAREVAIKFLHPNYIDDAEAVERFLREAQVIALLDHENIVKIHDSGVSERGPYLVMEKLTGETLKARLERGPLSQPLAIQIADQVLQGLAAAHRKGAVHRDIKPANIWISDRDAKAKLLDFGIAKLGDRTSITTTGAAMGTVTYMSPEQAAGKACGPPSDLYSLGVVLYEMLIGKPPFEGDTIQVLQKHVKATPPSLPARFPAHLRSAVAKALAKKPEQRFESAEAMRKALLDANAPGRPVRRNVLAVGALLALAIPTTFLMSRPTQPIRQDVPAPSASTVTVSRMEVIPFETREEVDATLGPGQTATQAGTNGEEEVTVEIRDGQERVLSRKVVRPPIPQVVRVSLFNLKCPKCGGWNTRDAKYCQEGCGHRFSGGASP